MANENNKKEYKLLFIGLGVLVLVILLWCLTIYFLKNDKERGTFGDMFGAVNALFSGLAFTGIIFTILLQREELSLQRLELQETRNELKRSADAQERSERALISQQNQTTFFNLLEQQKKLIETLRFGDKVGFAALRDFANDCRKKLTDYMAMEECKKFKEFSDTSNHISGQIHINRPQIITYLKNMQTIVSFIENNLSNDNLFHSILYNYISVPEKYLLGVCYHFCKGYETSFLKGEFDYIEHYENLLQEFKNESDKYFPAVGLQKTYYRNYYDEMFEKGQPIILFEVQVFVDIHSNKLKLVEVEVLITKQGNKKIVSHKIIDEDLFTETKDNIIKVNISKSLKLPFLELTNGDYDISYTFSFNYDSRIYKIPFVHSFHKTSEFNDDEQPTETSRYIMSLTDKD